MNEHTQDGRGSSIGIFPTGNGIAIQASDGENEVTLVLHPDDAARVAVNIITNISMVQINAAMQSAAEKAEIEKMKSLITKGDINVPFQKR